MGRLLPLAVLVALGGLAFGQEPAADEVLRRRLKPAVDRSLARFVRDLRAELHRIIDGAVDEGDPRAIARLLDDLEPARPPRPTPVALDISHERLPSVDRILRRLDQLRDLRAPDHPDLRRLEDTVRTLLGETMDAPRAPWHRIGLGVEPVSEVDRRRLELAPLSGLRVSRVDQSSPASVAGFRVGDLLVACDGKPVGLGQAGSVSASAGIARGVLTVVVDAGHGRRLVRTVRLPAALEDDPKVLMEEMLRRAIREVIPKDPVVVPPSSKGQGKKRP